jgi:hypothetical protein
VGLNLDGSDLIWAFNATAVENLGSPEPEPTPLKFCHTMATTRQNKNNEPLPLRMYLSTKHHFCILPLI